MTRRSRPGRDDKSRTTINRCLVSFDRDAATGDRMRATSDQLSAACNGLLAIYDDGAATGIHGWPHAIDDRLLTIAVRATTIAGPLSMIAIQPPAIGVRAAAIEAAPPRFGFVTG